MDPAVRVCGPVERNQPGIVCTSLAEIGLFDLCQHIQYSVCVCVCVCVCEREHCERRFSRPQDLQRHAKCC